MNSKINNKINKFLKYLFRILLVVYPLIFIIMAYITYQYRSYGLMISLTQPNGTIIPLFEPWVLFVAFAMLWIKVVIYCWLSNLDFSKE